MHNSLSKHFAHPRGKLRLLHLFPLLNKPELIIHSPTNTSSRLILGIEELDLLVPNLVHRGVYFQFPFTGGGGWREMARGKNMAVKDCSDIFQKIRKMM